MTDIVALLFLHPIRCDDPGPRRCPPLVGARHAVPVRQPLPPIRTTKRRHLFGRGAACCAPGPQDRSDSPNSGLSSPLNASRPVRTLKYLLTKSYRCVIFCFAERESRMCVSRPPHCRWKSPRAPAVYPSIPTHALPQAFCFQALTHSFLGAFTTHSFRTVCALLRKQGGIPPFRPKTELDSWCQAGVLPSLPSLGLSPHPNVPILGEVCLRSHFRFGFNQEGLS
jgi:hypothetical protein